MSKCKLSILEIILILIFRNNLSKTKDRCLNSCWDLKAGYWCHLINFSPCGMNYGHYIILCEGQVLPMWFIPVSTEQTAPAPWIFSYLVQKESLRRRLRPKPFSISTLRRYSHPLVAYASCLPCTQVVTWFWFFSPHGIQ